MDAKHRIDRDLVAETLALHTKAYALLMWLGDAARADPEVLSEASEARLLDRRACAAWLRDEASSFPLELAPSLDRALPYAALLGSFLRTSFHVSRLHWGGRLVDASLRLAPGHAGARAGKRSRHGGDPRTEALHRMCRDEGVSVPRTRLAKLAKSKAHEADVRLWTYAVGLVERARGGGEGQSEWAMYRKLEDRRSIDVARVWAARDRLLAALAAPH